MSISFPEIRSYAFNHKNEIISILLWDKIAVAWVFLFPLINDLSIILAMIDTFVCKHMFCFIMNSSLICSYHGQYIFQVFSVEFIFQKLLIQMKPNWIERVFG